MPKPRINTRASNVRAKVSITPQSWAQFEKALKRVEAAVRKEAMIKGLEDGGELIRSSAESKAPGPYIVLKVVTGAELMRGWKRSAGAQGIKADGYYAVIGPDKDHWHYRFSEYGVKAHGVTRRKRTRQQQKFRTMKVRSRDVDVKLKSAQPRMVFEIDGKLIFAKTVLGFAARPFLRPAVDSRGDAAVKKMGETIGAEIEKAARG